MPLHDYTCTCGNYERKFCKMADLPLPQICECGRDMQRRILAPMVQGDIPAYESPVDGRYISGRAARRDDLLRHNCVEYEPSLGEHQRRRTAESEQKLEDAVEETLDSEITRMPARKRELLEQEIRSGVDANLVRSTKQ